MSVPVKISSVLLVDENIEYNLVEHHGFFESVFGCMVFIKHQHGDTTFAFLRLERSILLADSACPL